MPEEDGVSVVKVEDVANELLHYTQLTITRECLRTTTQCHGKPVGITILMITLLGNAPR